MIDDSVGAVTTVASLEAIAYMERIDVAFTALLNKKPVRVKTATREFEGRVFQLFSSAYETHLTCGVVEEKMGMVHFFRLTKEDAEIEPLWGDKG